MPDIIITENGINKLLQNTNIHNTSGPDNIHGRILKECTTQIAPILTTLFSLSLKTGKISQLINSIFSDDNIRHLWILTLPFVWYWVISCWCKCLLKLKMICNIPVDDDKTPTSSKFPKNLFSYIKSQKSESSNIATLRQNGQLHSICVVHSLSILPCILSGPDAFWIFIFCNNLLIPFSVMIILGICGY
jgi:hypothetical protein